jgi:hypothetical protein
MNMLQAFEENVKQKEILKKKAELFDEMLEWFEELLCEAEAYYPNMPNSHRKSVEEYYQHERDIIARAKKLK